MQKIDKYQQNQNLLNITKEEKKYIGEKQCFKSNTILHNSVNYFPMTIKRYLILLFDSI